MADLLQMGRNLWRRCSLLFPEGFSPQLSLCCAFHSARQRKQRGDVQLSNIGALLASPPVYSRYGGLLRSCTHQLRFVETLLGGVSNVNKTLGSCTGQHCSVENTTKDFSIRGRPGAFSCYAQQIHTTSSFEPASTNSNNSLGKTLCEISVFRAASSLVCSSRSCLGLWNQRRSSPTWIGGRRFSSAANHKILSGLGLEPLQDTRRALADVEDETDPSLPNSDEDFDFRNFPALQSSFYENYERPMEMQVKRCVTWRTRTKPLNADSNLTVEAIPRPKGRTYDFGLGDMSSKPPPLEAGARPQGGFDIDLLLDECEAAPSQTPSSFPAFLSQRVPPTGNHTPEADNGSEIGTDPRRDEDSAWKSEQEFYWDPYDFDAIVEFPHKLEFEEGLSANVVS